MNSTSLELTELPKPRPIFILFLISLLAITSCKSKESDMAKPQPAAGTTTTENSTGTAVLPQVSTEAPASIEAYPARVARALSAHVKQRTQLPDIPAPRQGHPERAAFAISKLKRWDHQPITVSFLAGAGTDQLRSMIADTANEWGKYGNVKFDFGISSLGHFREWNPKDTAFTSDVRIAFAQNEGAWSLIGHDSTIPDPDYPDYTAPGLSSMNFGGFDTKLPSDWHATVLHEFGHALGFEHEIENPSGNCESEIIWGDPHHPTSHDLYGYMLQMYGWTPDIVDAQMRTPLSSPQAYMLSPEDPKSIMHYEVPSQFCKHANNPCCAAKNTQLSSGDKQGLLNAYPFDVSQQVALAQENKDLASKLLKLQRLNLVDKTSIRRALTAASARLAKEKK